MLYEVSHSTQYNYESPVGQSRHLLHLSPRIVTGQNILNHAISIDPTPSNRTERSDYFGNPTTIVTIEDDHNQITFVSTTKLEVLPKQEPTFAASPDWTETARIVQQLEAANEDPVDLTQYACFSSHTTPTAEIAAYAESIFTPGRPVLEGARELTARIFDEFIYDGAATDVATPLSKVMEMKRGVCQDFTHFALACLRACDLPARYVSGYLLTHPPEGQPRLVGADASHAWFSVWSPDCGWIDFDPTNNLLPSDEHITLAYGRDFADVSPISGVVTGGGAHQVIVGVDVKPILAKTSTP